MGTMGGTDRRAEPSAAAAGSVVDADFDALFRSTYPRLVVALGLLGDPAAAEDAVQDAFVQALRHWARVRTYDDPAAWVRRTARNRLANAHRSRRRRDRAVDRLGAATPGLDPATVGGGSDGAAVVDLRTALAGLPERERMVVVLHHVVGLPVAEIAAELDLPAGTVKSVLSRTRSRLRALLADDAEPDVGGPGDAPEAPVGGDRAHDR
jgi:RNA polymerase sigma-70 factor (ECF subfamily)